MDSDRVVWIQIRDAPICTLLIRKANNHQARLVRTSQEMHVRRFMQGICSRLRKKISQSQRESYTVVVLSICTRTTFAMCNVDPIFSDPKSPLLMPELTVGGEKKIHREPSTHRSQLLT